MLMGIVCVEWLAFSHAMCLYFICCFQFFSKIQKSKNPKIQKSKNPTRGSILNFDKN